MKKILLSLVLTFLAVATLVNTSFAQESKETAKAELNVAKTQQIKLRIQKAYLKQGLQHQNRLDTKPVKSRVKIKAEPARVKLNTSRIK
jgi:hypothetical protein